MGWSHIDDLSLPSQALVDAALEGDAIRVTEMLGNRLVDVNYVGVANLSLRSAEIVLQVEKPSMVKIESREYRMDVTALYAAAHVGSVEIARKLVSGGADVNQKLFRGYATTAAACKGHSDLLCMLVKAGASQFACEEALLEASLCGQVKAVEILICSEMTRPESLVHALVSASSRGFVDVVSTLVEGGVDVNCKCRVLLDSEKPKLHMNVNATPLVAAIVNRQVDVVKYLLEAGAKTEFQVQLGAWTWDTVSDEELRVGPGMGEPYPVAWAAVEYYESSGQILNLLLHHQPFLVEAQYRGRTLLWHAILCNNSDALRILLDHGAITNSLSVNSRGHGYFPIHLAAKLGFVSVLIQLISHGCEIDARNESGETALMLAAKGGKPDCFLELATAGADIGAESNSGESAIQLVKEQFGSCLDDIVSQAIIRRRSILSSNLDVFSPLHFVAKISNDEPLQILLQQRVVQLDVNKQDLMGYTPLMVAAKTGNSKTFQLLVMAGADISVKPQDGETMGSILRSHASDVVRDQLQQVLLDATLSNVLKDDIQFKALHYASKKGDLCAVVQLLKRGVDVNSLDEDGYSPLMLAAKEGHADVCKLLLLQGGAMCGLSNGQGDTALSLARRSSTSKVAEGVILNYLARSHVLAGEQMSKHTRGGRGLPHLKTVKMFKSGLLSWGKAKRRNVICREAAAGASARFCRNQRKGSKGDAIIFRVITVTGREIHFEVTTAASLELWIRGINLIAKEAAAGT